MTDDAQRIVEAAELKMAIEQVLNSPRRKQRVARKKRSVFRGRMMSFAPITRNPLRSFRATTGCILNGGMDELLNYTFRGGQKGSSTGAALQAFW